MPRHEVSVVNLQLGIKASKYLIHQPLLRIREPYFIYQKAARRLDPSFSLGRERNSSKFRIRKGTNLCSKICLLYLPFGWASSGGWLKLATRRRTAIPIQYCVRSSTAKTNFAEILRHFHGLCWFTSSYAVRPTFEPASTLPGARFSHETRRCNLNILYARQTYFRKCVDSANCSTDIPQVARQTTLKLPRLDESKKLLLVDSIASDFCLKKSS